MYERNTYANLLEFGRSLEADIRAYLVRDIKVFMGTDNLQHFRTWAWDLSSSKRNEGEKAISEYFDQVSRLALDVRPDVYMVFWSPDTCKGCTLFVEAKRKDSKPGFIDLFQLIGYCLVARAELGLLVNVDGPVPNKWEQYTWTHKHLFELFYATEEIPYENKLFVGVLKWLSSTKMFDYSQPRIGVLDSSSAIARHVCDLLSS